MPQQPIFPHHFSPHLVPGNTMDRAHWLCSEARMAVEEAAHQVTECRRLRAEHRRSIWSALRRPDQTPVVCVYCGRIRTAEDEWVSLTRSQSLALIRVTLSHGCCPDCMAKYSSS